MLTSDYMKNRSLYILTLLLWVAVGCKKDKSAFVNNPDPSGYNHERGVGASANDLLSNGRYTSLQIEIMYMPGFAPDASAITHLQNFLAAVVRKPGGITITQRQIAAAAATALSAEQVKQIENSNRTAFTSGSTLAVSILYTNGSYSTSNVLGIAYRNTSVALFGKTIHDNSGGLSQTSRTKLEATVLEHELSHLLGLVDIGSAMQTSHKDAAHGNHCDNSSCLMYYASETTDVLGFLVTGNIPSLDANCRADLRANGGQ